MDNLYLYQSNVWEIEQVSRDLIIIKTNSGEEIHISPVLKFENGSLNPVLNIERKE